MLLNQCKRGIVVILFMQSLLCVAASARQFGVHRTLFRCILHIAQSLQCAIAGAERRVPGAITALGQSGFVG